MKKAKKKCIDVFQKQEASWPFKQPSGTHGKESYREVLRLSKAVGFYIGWPALNQLHVVHKLIITDK